MSRSYVFALIRPFSWGFALAGLRFARATFSQGKKDHSEG